MNECHIERVKPMSIEVHNKKVPFRLGQTHTEESLAKMRGAPSHKKFPPKCNACTSRDIDICARYNMKCFEARDNICFRRYMKRHIHPDYIKKGVEHGIKDEL